MEEQYGTKETEMTVCLKGEIDHHSASTMREEIDAAVAKNRVKHLKLDFSGVSFMDSSGIGLIMGRYRLMQACGGKLSVIRVPEKLQKIMILSGLRQLNVLQEEEG